MTTENNIYNPENSGKTRNKDLSERQNEAAFYLGRGYSQKDTAEIVGVSARSIRNWNCDHKFQNERLRQQKQHLFELSCQAVGLIEIGLSHHKKNIDSNQASEKMQFDSANCLIEKGERYLHILKDSGTSLSDVHPPEKIEPKADPSLNSNPIIRGRWHGLQDMVEDVYEENRKYPFGTPINFDLPEPESTVNLPVFRKMWEATAGFTDFQSFLNFLEKENVEEAELNSENEEDSQSAPDE